ncbi:MAG TPA: hypothetical protein VMV51_09505 [Gemmatimonadaceae bacterium]|nr:hypothetical protein [Gemmatimonadaceae bacterium]
MSTKPVGDSLYDSEAALRLVDKALSELRDDGRTEPGHDAAETRVDQSSPIGLIGLSHILARAYAEITSVLTNLRESRALLEDAAVERLQHTSDKLREVSNATEMAATDILNRLEVAVGLVDEIEGVEESRRHEAATTLRDELFAMMGAMQFQDITAQQLSYASSVLVEMEERMTQLARIFDPAAFGTVAGTPTAPSGAFDPEASTENAEVRQAVADAIFDTNRKAC